jgi:hypothetical protein
MDASHAAALGRVVAAWSLLESCCGLVIRLLLDTDGEVGAALIAELSFLQRVNMVGALMFAAHNQELFDHWRDLMSSMDEARSERNDLVHAEWQIFQGRHSIVRWKARGRVTLRREEIPVPDMEELEAKIMNLADQIMWFQHQLARAGFGKMFTDAQTRPPPGLGQSQQSLSQDQAREAKRARKQASREHPKNRPKAPTSRA